MSDELDISELEGLMHVNSALPQDAVEVAAVAAAVNPAASALPDVVDSDHGHRKKKSKEDKHKKKTHSRHDDNSGGDDDGSGASEEDYPRRKRPKFILDAAESCSDSGSDNFIAGDDDGEESVEDGFDEDAVARRYAEPRKNFIFHDGDTEKSADELGREFEERDRLLRSGMLRSTETAGRPADLPRGMLSSLRYASHMLPQESDPKVFAVKCRPRMARVLVGRILNKCHAYRVGQNYEQKKVDLGIISAFCLDHVKEYIYVEAYRKLFVENALSGLVGLFRFNITVVDPSELMQMMEKRPSNEKVRIGSFVRLRQRFYRMDLAQVTAIHQDGIRVTCKIVPREDFVGKAFNKATTRLPPKFFAPSLALGAEYRGDISRWGDLDFDKDGYLLKTVSIRMVISGEQMEKPTTEELARFYNNNREQVREAIERSFVDVVAHTAKLLRIGDSVRVTSGQLRDTVGTIANIFTNTSTALLSCQVPGRSEPVNLRVELSACARRFMEGAHVIVEKGPHSGESGTVVKSWGDVVLLFPDRKSTVTELKVQANDCHQSKLVGSFSHSRGGLELFDLVTVSDTNSVGCVVCLNRSDVVVMTERNEVRTLTYAQVKPFARRGARQTTDRLENVLTRGAEVSIERTPNTPYNLGGETGTIKQLFNRTLFVLCRRRRENAGIVALDAFCVLLMGGRTTTRKMAPPPQLPAPMRRPHNATKADISLRHGSEEWEGNSEWYEASSTAP